MTALLKPLDLDTSLSCGLGRDMPMDLYQRHPAISRSMADHALRSAARFKRMQETASIETDAMRIGRRMHAALLEPETFWPTTVVWTGAKRQGKKWEAFEELHADKDILTVREESQLLKMADAFQSSEIGMLISGGEIECSYFWRDPVTGLGLKARLDSLAADGYIYDLKSTLNASEEAFAASIKKYGYHRQADWYLDAVEAVTGKRPKGFRFVAIEKPEGTEIAYYEIGPRWAKKAAAENARSRGVIAEGMRTGIWPGYADAPVILEEPDSPYLEIEE